MSQLTLTNEERTQRLQRLGYSEREAAFLCLAALHGGYFVRRQYGQYLGKALGGNIATLVEKAVCYRHLQATTLAGQTQVYHLCARPFYAALGQEDNRNRRLRSVRAIRAKLMALDFVLLNPGPTFLTTELEKVQYFTRVLGLDPSVLPAKRYVSLGRTTERFFVEKFPLFLVHPSQEASTPGVAFCYVDEGAASLCGFETFLQHYAALFTQLCEFQVIYVAVQDAHAEQARALFERWWRAIVPATSASADSAAARVISYFETRRQYENAAWSAFDRARLIQFRNDAREFSGDRFDALYQRWMGDGDIAVRTYLAATERPRPVGRGTFSAHILEQNYGFLGYIAGG